MQEVQVAMFGMPGGLEILVILVILGLPLLILWGIVRSASGGRGGRAGTMAEEEARTMQEIHAGLAKMEERIESLETLLVDKEEKSAH